MSSHTQTPLTTVTQSIVVEASVELAFEVFTTRFDEIKPREHNLLAVEIAETVLEPRVGGYLYDRGIDGSECRWARVLAYEPPTRLVISWDISPRWQLETDLEHTNEVEIRFLAEAENRTRVQLEHRHLDRHRDNWPTLRDSAGGNAGWPLYLRRYTALISAPE